MEKKPLPVACQDCQEDDCCNCDAAGKRWFLPEAAELGLRRKSLEKAIERLQRQIIEIDNGIAQIEESLEEPNVQMTQKMGEDCLWVCIQAGDAEQYNRLWNEYPDLAENMMREFYDVVARNPVHFTEEEIQAGLDRFKARMRAEYGDDYVGYEEGFRLKTSASAAPILDKQHAEFHTKNSLIPLTFSPNLMLNSVMNETAPKS